MECPFHAGNEAITTCVQCETPICPLCASETNQIHLCLNCYHARVEELAAGLGGASVRLAKERQKTEAKVLVSRKKKAGAPPAPAPEAKPAYELGAGEALWEKEEVAPAAPPPLAPPTVAPVTPFEAPPVAPGIPIEEPPSKKELAQLKKEEAKRLKAERKEAKRAAKGAAPEIIPEPVPPPMPEPAPFFEPPPEPPTFVPPPPETPPPPPPMAEMPMELTPEAPAEGIRLPKLEDRLEPLPPEEEGGEASVPPEMGPPEGFFD